MTDLDSGMKVLRSIHLRRRTRASIGSRIYRGRQLRQYRKSPSRCRFLTRCRLFCLTPQPSYLQVLIGGLTKGFRLPGWRVCWVVGPSELITAVGQSGGYIDGGASHILQRAALPLLEPSRVRSDRKALQTHFLKKRNHVLSRLKEMGFEIKNPPNATFYIWLDLRQLPKPMNSGMVFFEECLKEKVIVVPGQFFDVNPSSTFSLFRFLH